MSRIRSLCAVFVLAGMFAPARAQEADLKWKFEKGKTFYQEMTTQTKQSMKVMGQDVTQTQEQTFYFSWTPVEQKDKNWIVKQKIEGVKMKIEIGGNPIAFDSTVEATTAQNPLSDFFRALVGSEFTLTVSPEYKIIDIKGKEEFVKKLVQANQQMESLLKQILSDDALKNMSDPAFSVVPNKSVKKGESWEKKSTLVLGPIGNYETTYKYTYEGKDEKDKNLERIKVDATLKYSPPTDAGAANFPFKIKSADLKTKESKGEVLFDAAKGRVASSNLTQKLEGKLNIDIGGTSSEVDLSQTTTTTIKTSELSPLAKKAA